jgi:Tfp pilus assembly protein PilF
VEFKMKDSKRFADSKGMRRHSRSRELEYAVGAGRSAPAGISANLGGGLCVPAKKALIFSRFTYGPIGPETALREMRNAMPKIRASYPAARVEALMVRSFRSALLPIMILLFFATLVRAANATEESRGVAPAISVSRSDYAAGRAYYADGEFKKAAARFQLAVGADPTDADSYFWMGMAYQVLADVSGPAAGKYRFKARVCLTKAVALAPTRSDYRRELFNFLLDSSGRSASRQAAGILQSVSESDPDYLWMRERFERETRANSAVQARLGRWVLTGPETAWRIAEAPVSSLRDEKIAGQ